jgi:hypothetical protein
VRIVPRKLFTAAAAAVLALTPALAAAQQAAPAPTPAPAGETVQGSEIRGGFVIPLIVLLALVALIYLLTHEQEQDFPTSP